MRLFFTHKVGQSGYELVLSVFFSFFLHAAIIILSLLLYTSVTPKIYAPPSYVVKLVGPPAMTEPASAPPAAPPVAKPEPAPVVKKPEPKAKAAPPKPVVKALKKGDMPELSHKKTTPARVEDARPAKTEQARPAPKEATAAPKASSEGTAPAQAASKTTVGVAVSTISGDSRQLSSYSQIVRDCIERNWNPPPGVKGMRAKVSFKVLRTGRLFGDVNIEESSGNTYFDMAAKRAILSSSPFPSMPEEFYKQYAEFSVDVQERN